MQNVWFNVIFSMLDGCEVARLAFLSRAWRSFVEKYFCIAKKSLITNRAVDAVKLAKWPYLPHLLFIRMSALSVSESGIMLPCWGAKSITMHLQLGWQLIYPINLMLQVCESAKLCGEISIRREKPAKYCTLTIPPNTQFFLGTLFGTTVQRTLPELDWQEDTQGADDQLVLTDSSDDDDGLELEDPPEEPDTDFYIRLADEQHASETLPNKRVKI